MRAHSFLILLPLLLLTGCGDDSEVSEFFGFSGEVREVSASADTVRVGESVRIVIEVQTADAFGFWNDGTGYCDNPLIECHDEEEDKEGKS